MKRSELKRTSWLTRGTKPLSRETPIRKVNPERKARRQKHYANVLRSPHSRKLRARCIAEQHGRCATCGEPFRNERGHRATLSHLTYSRFGHELREDVQADCETCNAAERATRRWYNPKLTLSPSTP